MDANFLINRGPNSIREKKGFEREKTRTVKSDGWLTLVYFVRKEAPGFLNKSKTQNSRQSYLVIV